MKLLIFILISLLFLSCSKEEDLPIKELNNKQTEITLSDEEIKSNNIEFCKLEEVNLSHNISLTGKIDINPSNRIDIYAPHSGYIKNINLIEGDRVKKGELLFEIENLELINLQSKYVELNNSLRQVEKEFKRQSELFKENAISEKEFLEYEKNYNNIKNNVNSLEQELKYYKININNILHKNQFTKRIEVRAEYNAFVKHININNGKYVTKDINLLELIQTDHLHAELESPISNYNLITINDTIDISYNNIMYRAYVYQKAKAVDEKTNMFMIHSHFINEVDIPIGAFVSAKIHAEAINVQGLKSECVINVNQRHFVLAFENGKISEIDVKLGLQNEEYFEVLNAKDLEGMNVISKGAKALYNSKILKNEF